MKRDGTHDDRMPGQLRPRDERVTINHEFRSVEQFVREYVSNISRSGIFIRTDNPLAVGTKVNLCFTVILDELETVEGIGQVVRVSDDPSGMGVVFIRLDNISKNLIAKVLTRAGTVTGTEQEAVELLEPVPVEDEES